jgi:hypothetical protein
MDHINTKALQSGKPLPLAKEMCVGKAQFIRYLGFGRCSGGSLAVSLLIARIHRRD